MRASFLLIASCLLASAAASGPDSDALQFMGAVRPVEKVEWSAPCFKNNTAYVTLESGETEAYIHIQAEESRDFHCSDIYLIATASVYTTETVIVHGSHKAKLKLDADALEFVKVQGIQVFRITEEFIPVVEHLFEFILTIVNKHSHEYSMEFLKTNMNVTFEKRSVTTVPIQESDLKSGDMLSIMAFDGVGLGIMYFTGGMTQHSVMLLRTPETDPPAGLTPDTLYALESTGSEGRSGQYAVPFAQWYPQYIKNFCHTPLDCGISVLPLDPALHEKFDEAATWAFFEKVSHQKYGSQSLLYSAVDTLYDNYPPPLLYAQEMPSYLMLLSHLKEQMVNVTVLQGACQRLNISPCDLTYEKLFDVLDERGMTFYELMAIPESDAFSYPELNGGAAWLCSSFVMGLYNASGIFGELSNQIDWTEFTPKDTYELQIWDRNYKRPEYCEVGDGLPYCQIWGQLIEELPLYNSVPPYAHMNSKCPSTLYTRKAGC